MADTGAHALRHPIPIEALDDRLAFVGTSGSGKTYNAGTAVEKLLNTQARVGIIDPLSAWWGLRMAADGKRASRFDVVIFGGEHADLPLTEAAGSLIGETCAQMSESFILDLSGLGTKAAERRFMLAFLTALYRKTAGEPLHVVIDEADMWAPQMLSDRDGDAAKLLGMMETIVRRGRIKGFVPWLITQRPAVLSKNVLSQADGLVAMKLTSSQDRGALGDWIEGQADRAEGKRILATMPTLQRGEGVVWIPGRGVLTTALFPTKATFDSSRTPARGEKKRAVTLRPLDLDALKARLSTVEAETKANDPKVLKARIAELEREAKKKAAPAPAAAPQIDVEAIRQEAWEKGHEAAWPQAFAEGVAEGSEKTRAAIMEALGRVDLKGLAAPKAKPAIAPASRAVPVTSGVIPAHVGAARPAPRPSPPRGGEAAPTGDLTKPQMKIIEALAFWASLDIDKPSRDQIAAASGYSATSGGLFNLIGQLRGAGFVEYPIPNHVEMTDAGRAIAPPPSGGSARDRLAAVLSAPQAKVLDALADGEVASREEIAARTGYSPTSGGLFNLIGSLRSLGLVTYPKPNHVLVEPWVFG